jgi:hypothetical protein
MNFFLFNDFEPCDSRVTLLPLMRRPGKLDVGPSYYQHHNQGVTLMNPI